jgi:hypothetical protein
MRISVANKSYLLFGEKANLVLEDAVLLPGPVLAAAEAVQVRVRSLHTPM